MVRDIFALLNPCKGRGFGRKLRRELLQEARGHILEVAVGKGRNFEFYPQNAQITAVDVDASRLEEAKKQAEKFGISADFIHAMVEDTHLTPQTYDTVVSTLSLCSYKNPVEVLRSFGKYCRPDGKILLLEHGLSDRAWLARIQHKLNKLHLHLWGCNYNRDIKKFLEISGLKVDTIERHIFGTVYVIHARPASI